MEEKNKNRIDGFAISGGIIKQVIILKDGIYYFNWENYPKDKLIKRFKETIQNKEILDFNIKCLDDCVDMKWLTEDLHFKLSKEPDISLKIVLAEYSDKYHEQFKDDYYPRIRKIVAKYSDKYHEQFKDDPNWDVRKTVAEYSDKYHEQFKDDPNWEVREAVAKYSDKYHEQFKDDPDWSVRMVVAKYSDKYHEQFKDDPDREIRKFVHYAKLK